MKAHSLILLTLAGCLASSCIYYTEPVPDMPYGVHQPYPAAGAQSTQALNAARTEGAWFTSGSATTPAPAPVQPVATPTPAPQPAAAPAPRNGNAITQPLDLTRPAPKPATPAPAPAPKPAPTPAPSNGGKPYGPETTNNGPIPVASPVPGDPTRVYNPLDSSRTIRIVDKNGNIHPSGKELKVPGTKFHFYVP